MVPTNQHREAQSSGQSGRGRGRRVRGITLFGWLESRKNGSKDFFLLAGREIVNYYSQYLTSPKFLKISTHDKNFVFIKFTKKKFK